ncbi:MAG: NAD(+) diphosphatase [Dermatophilaceae bacterium]
MTPSELHDSGTPATDGRFAPVLLDGIPLTGPALDRHAEHRADSELLTRLLADPATRVLDIADGRAPARDPGRLAWRAPAPDDLEAPDAPDLVGAYLGADDHGRHHVALLNLTRPAPGDWLALRAAGAQLTPSDGGALTAAVALANWHATHRFCPRCGAPTRPHNAGWTRRCTADGTEHFPRTDPAIIVAVLDPDDRLLLARHPAWPVGRMSVLAGFVEPGESLAQCVRREVLEEVGVTLSHVRYLGDQPWPFPASLMLGFEARADGADLTLDPTEIAEARWVTRDGYRELVASGELLAGTSLSISRRLVLRWLATG